MLHNACLLSQSPLSSGPQVLLRSHLRRHRLRHRSLSSSSTNVAALIAKAKHDHKPGQANVVEPLLQLAPYSANLEYRTSVGPAAIHVHEDEFFYVIDGSGTFVTGGSLTHPVQTNAENLSGDSIEGGTATPVAKGDFFVVPENTPHWFGAIHGRIVPEFSDVFL